MAAQGLDACLISNPENIYYLTGLNHQGYFAYEMLVVPLESRPILVSRAMERATIQQLTPPVRHVCYSDGADPLPPPRRPQEDVVLAERTRQGEMAGLQPWSMSVGVSVRGQEGPACDVANPAKVTCEALKIARLDRARLGIEKDSSFLPLRIAEGILSGLPEAHWEDASGLVQNCRMVQSPLELECTRKAAEISDSMMLSGIAAAGPGVEEQDVMAAIYQAMFHRGGTYPAFIPLVRSTHALDHEHATWQDKRLRGQDMLFLELAGCYWRYHAPVGRLVYIGKAPNRAHKIHAVCREALERAIDAMAPGVTAGKVYQAWQRTIDAAGLEHYRRHHCGYAVGIGFPPSWSGSGVPVGLRESSTLELKPGMVFHVLSWLLRTGHGDSFLSDTVVVTERGSEVLTRLSRDLYVR